MMRDAYFDCPVCGMKSDLQTPAATYNGMRYFFCSLQCHDTFKAHPRLYGTRKPSKNRRVKSRIMKLTRPITPAEANSLRQMLLAMMGVEKVAIKGRDLRVVYDLMQTSAAQIEANVARTGFLLNRGWLHRIRSALIQENEEAELATLAAGKAPCCNKPPK